MSKIIKSICILIAVLSCTALFACGGDKTPTGPEDLSVVTLNGVTYTLLQDDTYEITSVSLPSGVRDIVVPDLVKEKTVSSVGYSAFQGLRTLKSVVLPATVKTLKTKAFIDCKLLSSVTASGVETIGESAFASCGTLTSLNFSNVKSVGKSAFVASGLSGVIELNAIEYVDELAFSGCRITKVVLGANIQKLNLSAFRNCGNTLLAVERMDNQNEWCFAHGYGDGSFGWIDKDMFNSNTIPWKQWVKNPEKLAEFMCAKWNDDSYFCTREYRTAHPNG